MLDVPKNPAPEAIRAEGPPSLPSGHVQGADLAGPPLVAALRAFEVRHDDVAEDAEPAQEIGMWPI